MYEVCYFIMYGALTSFCHYRKGKNSQKKVISYVDTSLNGSQKYVLRVDDKPFYMTNVQVRFDKLRYRWNWDIATCERLIKETAALGFNTLSIPNSLGGSGTG